MKKGAVMRGLIQNEIKFFFGRKNVFILIAAFMSIFFIFQFVYVREYQEYQEQKIAELENADEDIFLGTTRTANWVIQAKADDTVPEEIVKDAQTASQIWNTYQALNNLLKGYWVKWEENEDEIRKLDEMLDRQLLEVTAQKKEYGIVGTNIYRNTKRDWNERMLLREAYNDAGSKIPINPVKPTGAYVVSDALSGSSVFFLVMIMCVVLLNYDCWASEFEQTTCKLLFTIPYSRTSIFMVRYLTRIILTLTACGLLIGGLFANGMIRYGSGLDDFQIISAKGMKDFFFSSSIESLLNYDEVKKIGTIVSYEILLTIFFVIGLVTLVHALSLLTRNQMSTLIIIAVSIIAVVTYVSIPKVTDNLVTENAVISKLNPFLMFLNQDILLGNMGIGLPAVGGVLLGGTLLLNILMIICIKHMEV